MVGRFLKSSASVIALCAAGATAASAQDSDADGNDVERIVVTGTGIETIRDEALQAVDVITADELLAVVSGSLGDALASEPGVSSTFFGPAAGRPVIRGLGEDRIRVLNNGISMLDVSSSSPDHATVVEVFDADSIEILRGPAAIAFGGNAVGGVVNVNDGRIPLEPMDELFAAQLRAGASSVDDGRYIGGRGQFSIGALTLQLEGLHREAADYEIPGFAESALQRALEEAEEEDHDDDHDEEEGEEAFGSVDNSDFEFNVIGGGFGLTGDWGAFGASIRSHEGDYGLPGGHGHEHDEEEEEEHEGEEHEEEEEGDVRLNMEQTRVDVRGAFNVAFGPFHRFDVSAGFADYEHQEIEGSGEVGTTFENDGYEARFTLRNGMPGDQLAGSIGVTVLNRDFSAVGEEAFVQPVETNDIGIFAAQRYDLGDWGLEGGARLETRNLEPSVGDERDFTMFSASGGVFWRPAPATFLSASLSRTERAPTDVELFADGPHLATNQFEVGDANLDTETAWSAEGVARWFNDRARIEFSIFYSDFSDFIFLSPTGLEEDELPVFVFVQDDARLWGGEVQAEATFADFSAGSLGAWSFFGDAQLDIVRGETDNLGDLPRIPPYSATLGLGLRSSWATLRGEVEHVGEQDSVAEFELPTESYTFVNLSAAFHPQEDIPARIVFELNNAFDEEGRVHSSFLKDLLPLPGRNARVAIAYDF